MAGWTTNGVQPVAPITVNGTLTSVVALTNNGTVVTEGAPPVFTQLPAASLTSMDITAASGQLPTTVAATAFQVAAHTAGLISNTGSSTAGAATLNTKSGLVTTESLTTAAGGTYSFVLTNSLITTSTPAPQVQVLDGTNTAGSIQINSVTNAAGAATIVIQNTGSAAFNGKLLFAFHV
jgi:hypothetical protein